MRWGYLTAAAGLMGVIFLLSSLPDVSPLVPPFPLGLDKVAHAVVYALLGYLLGRGLGTSAAASAGAAVAAALYGLTDEWHQSFVPGREATLGDLAADAVGGATGAVAALVRGRGTDPLS